ncbi:MAG: VanZ family protein, partial [Gammaproteobacteria bacterium]|nr:VanZ family protein [Gammaproteobacteria bacterium]
LSVELFYQPYKLVGSQLLANPEFSEGFAGWGLSRDGVSLVRDGWVRLSNDDGLGSVALSQEVMLPSGVEDVVLSAQAGSSSIAVGMKSWNSGRVVLVSYPEGSSKPDYHRPHQLFSITGSTDWQEYSELLHVYPGIDRMKLQVQLSRTSGVLDVKGLQLFAAEYKVSWLVIKVAMIVSGLVLLGWVFLPYLRYQSGRGGLLALGTIFMIVAFTAMPNALKSTLYGLLKEWLAIVLSLFADHSASAVGVIGEGKGVVVESQVLTGKTTYFFALMHYLFFTVATVFLLFSFPDKSIRQKVYDLFTLAVMTECIQIFVRDRGPSVLDVGIDMVGVLTGVAIYFLAKPRLR